MRLESNIAEVACTRQNTNRHWEQFLALLDVANKEDGLPARDLPDLVKSIYSPVLPSELQSDRAPNNRLVSMPGYQSIHSISILLIERQEKQTGE
jgi:hypothetical protein